MFDLTESQLISALEEGRHRSVQMTEGSMSIVTKTTIMSNVFILKFNTTVDESIIWEDRCHRSILESMGWTELIPRLLLPNPFLVTFSLQSLRSLNHNRKKGGRVNPFARWKPGDTRDLIRLPVICMEYIPGNTDHFLQTVEGTYSALGQGLMNILMLSTYQITHYDLSVGNIIMNKIQKNTLLVYRIGKEVCMLPSTGFISYLIDFSSSFPGKKMAPSSFNIDQVINKDLNTPYFSDISDMVKFTQTIIIEMGDLYFLSHPTVTRKERNDLQYWMRELSTMTESPSFDYNQFMSDLRSYMKTGEEDIGHELLEDYKLNILVDPYYENKELENLRTAFKDISLRFKVLTSNKYDVKYPFISQIVSILSIYNDLPSDPDKVPEDLAIVISFLRKIQDYYFQGTDVIYLQQFFSRLCSKLSECPYESMSNRNLTEITVNSIMEVDPVNKVNKKDMGSYITYFESHGFEMLSVRESLIRLSSIFNVMIRRICEINNLGYEKYKETLKILNVQDLIIKTVRRLGQYFSYSSLSSDTILMVYDTHHRKRFKMNLSPDIINIISNLGEEYRKSGKWEHLGNYLNDLINVTHNNEPVHRDIDSSQFPMYPEHDHREDIHPNIDRYYGDLEDNGDGVDIGDI